jgi:hypothetical protein
MGRPSARQIEGGMDEVQMRQRLRKVAEKELARDVILLGKKSEIVRGSRDALEDCGSFVLATL